MLRRKPIVDRENDAARSDRKLPAEDVVRVNVADASISFGALLLAYDLIFSRSETKQDAAAPAGETSAS